LGEGCKWKEPFAGEKKIGGSLGGGGDIIFQFVDLTKVANAEKHAFYTVTLFPIFLSEKFAK
jgi:hypothetical protein